jgi:PHD/YefM family antitoxin component YafN of YafNO toxin-antitoxin module
MNSISISQLKINPSKAIQSALDFPVAVENRNKVEAYLIGKDLYEKMASFMEDIVDRKAVDTTDFNKGQDFEDVASDLNL